MNTRNLTGLSKFIIFEISRELSLKDTVRFSGVNKDLYRKVRYKIGGKVPCLRRDNIEDELDGQRYLSIMQVTFENKTDVLKVYLDAGVNVDTRGDRSGIEWTPLMKACWKGYYEAVEILLNNKAKLNNFYGYGDHTPLYLASSGGFEKIVKLLLDRGVDINELNYDKRTSLIAAVENNHISIVKLLVKRGADIDISGIDNNTALSTACKRGHSEIVKFLVKRGANIGKNSNIALMEACKFGKKGIVEILVNAGADVNEGIRSNPLYFTPIDQAYISGHEYIEDYLKSKGAFQNYSGNEYSSNPLVDDIYIEPESTFERMQTVINNRMEQLKKEN